MKFNTPSKRHFRQKFPDAKNSRYTVFVQSCHMSHVTSVCRKQSLDTESALVNLVDHINFVNRTTLLEGIRPFII